MVFISRWDCFQICLEALLVIEEKVGEFLQGEIGVFICLNGTSVQCCGLIQCGSQTNLVQAMEEIIHTDSAFSAAVPLCKNTMQVGPRGVLAAQCPSDIHNSLLVDCFLEGQRLVRGILLTLSNGFFKALSGAVSYVFGESTALVWVRDDVSLVCLHG